MEKFSKRFGHGQNEAEISIREGAPEALRHFIIMLLYDLGYGPAYLRRMICSALRVAPDPDNWTEYPNIEREVQSLITECLWYSVYDIIETFAQKLPSDRQSIFQEEVNAYFRANGIGWKLENGAILYRSDETFETALVKVETVLDAAKLQTAKSEIKEAIADLSRRPKPDITGAIQHSLASLECVCREVTGDRNMTLGELMNKKGSIVPAPLDSAISKIWGFTSEKGRHLKEGKEPEYLEAELVVELSAALSTYLGKKMTTDAMKGNDTPPNDLPF